MIIFFFECQFKSLILPSELTFMDLHSYDHNAIADGTVYIRMPNTAILVIYRFTHMCKITKVSRGKKQLQNIHTDYEALLYHQKVRHRDNQRLVFCHKDEPMSLLLTTWLE